MWLSFFKHAQSGEEGALELEEKSEGITLRRVKSPRPCHDLPTFEPVEDPLNQRDAKGAFYQCGGYIQMLALSKLDGDEPAIAQWQQAIATRHEGAVPRPLAAIVFASRLMRARDKSWRAAHGQILRV